MKLLRMARLVEEIQKLQVVHESSNEMVFHD